MTTDNLLPNFEIGPILIALDMLGIAVFAARRLRTRLLILIMAPMLNFGLTMIYHEWLHIDAFPSGLLGREARERRIELREREELALRKYKSAEQADADQPTAAMDLKSE